MACYEITMMKKKRLVQRSCKDREERKGYGSVAAPKKSAPTA